jgi:hypothetical protein
MYDNVFWWVHDNAIRANNNYYCHTEQLKLEAGLEACQKIQSEYLRVLNTYKLT